MDTQTMALETAGETLLFHPDTGRLVSCRSRTAPEQELIASSPDDPVCALQYLQPDGEWRLLTSHDAARTVVSVESDGIRINVERLGGLELDVCIRVRADGAGTPSRARWTASVRNDAGLRILDLQFPFVLCPYELGGARGTERLLWPLGPGVLLEAPRPEDLKPDHPRTWQLRPENGDFSHYPGYTVAQFLAWFNERAGILLRADDAEGRVKLIQPVHRGNALRLGMAHVGDWSGGERTLEYGVVLETFQGDWHDAAEAYRRWSLGQPWARRGLAEREDVPAWLLDSPPHIIIRLQGMLDTGPTPPIPEFLPYEKCIPLLDTVSKKIGSPVVPVIMSWEKPGPWVYPDCFPPVGGAESLARMTAIAARRGWHVGSFCNGTRWVVGHFWNGYDGRETFNARGGERAVCRTMDGGMWPESWDATWRPSYPTCLGSALTRSDAESFVRTLRDMGLDWIQFFDQNVGCATFPCFSADHDHPDVPGRWMTDRMHDLIASFRRIGQGATVFSVEGPVNEVFLQEIQLCDIRVVPPGHRAGPVGFGGAFVPLYHYLYHEHMVIQGGFGAAPEPYHLPIRNAYNLVVGEIPGAVLQGDGVLLNKDTFNWANWEPPVGNDAHSIAMLRSATALRRGPARAWLVYGRMLRPAAVRGVRIVRWRTADHRHAIPSVFHVAWRAPEGTVAVALANWTDTARTVTVRDARLGGVARVHVSGKSLKSRTARAGTTGVQVTIPPLGCALVEAAHGAGSGVTSHALPAPPPTRTL